MPSSDRLHALDAARAFALISGVVLHASLSFIPNFPAIAPGNEPSRSPLVLVLFFAIHVWRMAAFFLIAGFFARMMLQAKGTWGFARNRLVRIVAPLVVGWPIVMALIVAIWIAGTALTGAPAPKPPPAPAGAHALLPFPLTHLWFLYILALIYLVAVPARGLVAALDGAGRLRAEADRLLAAIVRFRLGVAALAAPVCLALYLQPHWLMVLCVPTPDQSLVPPAATACIFAMCFTVGWLLHRQPDLLQLLGRRWAFYLAYAVVMIGLCLVTGGGLKGAVTPQEGLLKFIAAARCALAMWTSIFALIGICVRFFSAASPRLRFLADASYWVYLAHLPVVMLLQSIAAQLPLPWEVKLPVIVMTTLGVTLLSYSYLVRYSFIGAVLNGRRKRPAKRPAIGAAVPA